MAEQNPGFLDLNDPELQKYITKPEQQPSPKPQGEVVDPTDTLRSILATGARVSGPWLGRIGGAILGGVGGTAAGPAGTVGGAVGGGIVGSGLGSAAGEAIAEMIEPRADKKSMTDLSRLSAPRIATEAVLGAVPVPFLSKAGKPIESFVRGSVMSAAGNTARRVAEGEELSSAADPRNWSFIEQMNVPVGGLFSGWLAGRGPGAHGATPPSGEVPPNTPTAPAPDAPRANPAPPPSTKRGGLGLMVEKEKAGVPLTPSEQLTWDHFLKNDEELKNLPSTLAPDARKKAAALRVKVLQKAEEDSTDQIVKNAQDWTAEQKALEAEDLDTHNRGLKAQEEADKAAGLARKNADVEQVKEAEGWLKEQDALAQEDLATHKAGREAAKTAQTLRANADDAQVKEANAWLKEQAPILAEEEAANKMAAEAQEVANQQKLGSVPAEAVPAPNVEELGLVLDKLKKGVPLTDAERASFQQVFETHVKPSLDPDASPTQIRDAVALDAEQRANAEARARIQAQKAGLEPSGPSVVESEAATGPNGEKLSVSERFTQPQPGGGGSGGGGYEGPAPGSKQDPLNGPNDVSTNGAGKWSKTHVLPEGLSEQDAAKIATINNAAELRTRGDGRFVVVFGRPKPLNFNPEEWAKSAPEAPATPPPAEPPAPTAVAPVEPTPTPAPAVEATPPAAPEPLAAPSLNPDPLVGKNPAERVEILKEQIAKEANPSRKALLVKQMKKLDRGIARAGQNITAKEAKAAEMASQQGALPLTPEPTTPGAGGVATQEPPKTPVVPVKAGKAKTPTPETPPPATTEPTSSAPEAAQPPAKASGKKVSEWDGLTKNQRIDKLMEGVDPEKVTPEMAQLASQAADDGEAYASALAAYKANPSDPALKKAYMEAGTKAKASKQALDKSLAGLKPEPPPPAPPPPKGGLKVRKAPPGKPDDTLLPETSTAKRDPNAPLMTYDDMVRESGMSQKNIYRAIRAGYLKDMPAAGGTRSVRVHPEDFADWIKRGRPTGGRESGFGSVDLMSRMALGGVGALTGAAMDEDHPFQGALMGGAAGALVPSVARRIPELVDAAKSGKLKETASQVYKELPNYQRFSLLADFTGLPANTAAPFGSGAVGAIEKLLGGDKRGLGLMNELLEVDTNLKNAKSAYNQALEGAVETGRADMIGKPKGPAERMMARPGAIMTAGDIVTQRAGQRAGFTPQEMKRMTLTNEPEWELSQSVMNFGKSRNDVISKLMLPFKRTALNIVESGIDRTPGIGIFSQLAKDPHMRDSLRMNAAKQGMGWAAYHLAYKMGESTDPEDAALAKKWISNMSGQYALLASAGFAAGQAEALGKNKGENWVDRKFGSSKAIQTSILGDLPLPTTQTAQDVLTLAANGFEKPINPEKTGAGRWIPRWALPGVFSAAGEDQNPNPAVENFDELLRQILEEAQIGEEENQ